MNTTRSCIFTTVVTLFSMVPLVSMPSKDQILGEIAALQANPDTCLGQQFYSKVDGNLFVASRERVPSLYGMVGNLAAKLNISVPRILVYTGYDADFSNGAYALSLYHNFGVIFIGHKLIGKLAPAELEAIIAHELNHIAYNHTTITTPLVFLGKVISMIPIVSGVHAKYVALLNTLLRYHEVQADLGAVDIINDPQMLINGLSILAMDGVSDARIKADCNNNPYEAFQLNHPLTEDRKAYIAAAGQKKGRA